MLNLYNRVLVSLKNRDPTIFHNVNGMEDITLNEISQMQKEKYCMSSFR
jgi:hypothetical protein